MHAFSSSGKLAGILFVLAVALQSSLSNAAHVAAASGFCSSTPIRTIDVYLLTHHRVEQLLFTAQSIAASAAKLDAACVVSRIQTNIHIHVDVPCDQHTTSDAIVSSLTFAKKWRWGGSNVACGSSNLRGGILAQWAHVPPAASPSRAVLVVEDDVTLAPNALLALVSLWGAVDNRADDTTAGVSLHHLGYSAREGRHLDASFCHSVLANSSETDAVTAIRSPVVSTWAFSPHPRVWAAFTRWLAQEGILHDAAVHETALSDHGRLRALSATHVNTTAFTIALTSAADALHAARCLYGSCPAERSAPYASLLWGMQDIRRGRGHQIWSAAFHAFSVLTAAARPGGLHVASERTWAFETVYPCFPLGPSGVPRIAALHTRAAGVHHAGESAVVSTDSFHTISPEIAKQRVTAISELDWFGERVPPLGQLEFMERVAVQGMSDQQRLLPAATPVAASTAFNRGAPGSLTTPSGAAMNKVAHATDVVARTLQSMAWRGIANPFGSMLTRGHDYLEALRGRTIVFFGDSTDRRTLAALYDLLTMGRYHLSLDFDGGCFKNALSAAAFCRSNASATDMNIHGDADWMRMRFNDLNLTIGYCLLRMGDPVRGKKRPIVDHVQGCAQVNAALLAKKGVIGVVNGWMHFLDAARGPAFSDRMAENVGELVRHVHTALPAGAPLIVRSPLPFHDGRYPRSSPANAIASLRAWVDVRDRLRLLAPGRKMIEWDVFTPFFQASSSNAFKHSKTTDGMHPGASASFAASIFFIELLQHELPVTLPAAKATHLPAQLPQWEDVLSGIAVNTSQNVVFDFDRCPDCDCRHECRFWGGVKQDVDCGNSTGNSSNGVSAHQLWSPKPWVRPHWNLRMPNLTVVALALAGCVTVVLAAARACDLEPLESCMGSTLKILVVCIIANCANRMPPALQLLDDEYAVLFVPTAVLLLVPLLTTSPAASVPTASTAAAIPASAPEKTALLTTPEDVAEIAQTINEITNGSAEQPLPADNATAHGSPPVGAPPGKTASTEALSDQHNNLGTTKSAPKEHTLKHTSPAYALSREVTEEWKGWMQLWFLLYHVLRAEAAYPYIRWTVSAYVFLTGYGNTLYYFGHGKVSAQRIVGMLVRMCLFSVLLSGATGTPWYLYYIPFLHAVHYLTTTVACVLSMRLQSACGIAAEAAHACAALCALLPGLLLEMQWGSDAVGSALSVLFGPAGGAYLLMRLQLDRYSSAVGIVAALVVTAANTEASASAQAQSRWGWLCDGIIGRWHAARQAAAAAMAMLGLAVALTHSARADYKLVNAYVGTLWIPAYLELRLWVLPRLQLWWVDGKQGVAASVATSRVLAWFGRHSLECYLLQFHLLMTASAGAILVIWPQVLVLSCAIQGCLYIGAVLVSFSATDALRRALSRQFWLVLLSFGFVSTALFATNAILP